MKVVAEQVRATLKPFFQSGVIDKDAYKEIMRKAVPKVILPSTIYRSTCLCVCAIRNLVNSQMSFPQPHRAVLISISIVLSHLTLRLQDHRHRAGALCGVPV